MEQSLSEASCSSAGQEVLFALRNQNICYHVYSCLPLAPILNHMNPFSNFHPVFFRSILILFSHQCLGCSISLFPSSFPTKYPVCMSHLLYKCHMPHPCHRPWLNHHDSVRCAVHIVKLFTMQFSQPYCFFLFIGPKYLPQHHIPENTQLMPLPWC